MEMAGSADLFGWVTSSAQELEGGRALLRPPGPGGVPVASFLTDLIVSSYLLQRNFYEFYSLQLSATDISAQAPMKGAAKCDNHCELQNSVNQWILERALHSRDIPGSMPASVLVEPSCRCGPSCVHSPASLCAMAALSGGASGTCRSVRRELQLLQLVSLHHIFVTDSCGAPTNSS